MFKRLKEKREHERVKALYQNSERFRLYVDRYIKTYKISADEALRHKLVREVAWSYQGEEKGHRSVMASTYAPMGKCV
ncbi:MAG: hypothetical protein NC517_09905 [Firmicutes bacterium]|nr:hypothetical protein [Bacillota bacterium]